MFESQAIIHVIHLSMSKSSPRKTDLDKCNETFFINHRHGNCHILCKIAPITQNDQPSGSSRLYHLIFSFHWFYRWNSVRWSKFSTLFLRLPNKFFTTYCLWHQCINNLYRFTIELLLTNQCEKEITRKTCTGISFLWCWKWHCTH